MNTLRLKSVFCFYCLSEQKACSMHGLGHTWMKNGQHQSLFVLLAVSGAQWVTYHNICGIMPIPCPYSIQPEIPFFIGNLVTVREEHDTTSPKAECWCNEMDDDNNVWNDDTETDKQIYCVAEILMRLSSLGFFNKHWLGNNWDNLLSTGRGFPGYN